VKSKFFFGICIEHFIITYEISKCYNTRVRYFSQEAFIQFRFISDALEYIKSGYIVIQNVAYECRIIDLRRNLESDSFGNQSEANSSNKLNNSPQKSSFSSNSNSIVPPPGPSSNQNFEAQPSDAQNNSKNLSLTDYSSKYNVSDRMESNTKDALQKVSNDNMELRSINQELKKENGNLKKESLDSNLVFKANQTEE